MMISCAKTDASPAPSLTASTRGFSLVELLVTMTIFGILMTGVFSAYIAQMKNTAREYGIAEADIDRSVGQGIITRDIFMAGYGLADDYNGAYTPWALQATDGGTGGADTLTLMGTALALDSQQSQHWSYVTNVTADQFRPKQWLDDLGIADTRENIQNLDMVILIDPSSKRLLIDGAGSSNWLFKYIDADNDITTPADNHLVNNAGTNLNPVINNAVLYGLYKFGVTVATQPYYAVRYYISTAPGEGCATGVHDLLRAESRTSETPASGDQIIPCVADFEVAIGLDTNSDREIDLWQNGGVTTGGGYDPARLNRSLRQVRLYALAQIGPRDRFYTYPTATIYVGDPSLGTGLGRTVTLTAEQRHYRWRVIRFIGTPRNIR